MRDERSDLFKRFVWFWVRAGMRRRFYSVMVWNGEILRNAAIKGPAVVYSNHSSWWDAFVDHMLERVFGLNHYSLVDARTLETQAWLKRIGALGVDLRSPRGSVAALRNAVEFLRGGPRAGRHPTLLLFPQGRIVPAWKRPLGFEGGLSWIQKNVPEARLIPLARRYEFLKEDRPHIFLEFGEPIDPVSVPGGVLEATQLFEVRLARTMDALQHRIESGDLSGGEILLSGGMAINKKWEWLQRAARGKTREFVRTN